MRLWASFQPACSEPDRLSGRGTLVAGVGAALSGLVMILIYPAGALSTPLERSVRFIFGLEMTGRSLQRLRQRGGAISLGIAPG